MRGHGSFSKYCGLNWKGPRAATEFCFCVSISFVVSVHLSVWAKAGASLGLGQVPAVPSKNLLGAEPLGSILLRARSTWITAALDGATQAQTWPPFHYCSPHAVRIRPLLSPKLTLSPPSPDPSESRGKVTWLPPGW